MKSRRALLASAMIGALACQRSDSRDGDSTTADSIPRRDTVAIVHPDTATTQRRDSASAPASSRPSTPSQPPAPGGTRPNIPEPLSIPRPDTARGIVRIVGSEPMTALVIARTDVPNEILSLTGTAQSQLRSIVGAEVKIIGRQTSDRNLSASPRGAFKFMVDSFVVRASDGIAAHDGILESSNGQYFLRTSSDTRLRIIELPAALRQHVGARIYIVGDVARPSAWGTVKN